MCFTESYCWQANIKELSPVRPYPYRVDDQPLFQDDGGLNPVYYKANDDIVPIPMQYISIPTQSAIRRLQPRGIRVGAIDKSDENPLI